MEVVLFGKLFRLSGLIIAKSGANGVKIHHRSVNIGGDYSIRFQINPTHIDEPMMASPSKPNANFSPLWMEWTGSYPRNP